MPYATGGADATGNSQGEIAGFGGVAQAIPGLNIFSPAITAMLSGNSQSAIRDAMVNNATTLGDQVPTFDKDGGYQNAAYTGDLSPKLYGSPEAAQAQLAQMDPQTLAARRAAISQMLDAGNGTAAAQMEAQRRQALYDSANQAGAQSAGLREEMAARGQGGAGAEWAMRQRAGQSGANQAMMGGLQAAANGQAQKLAALSAYENSLGGLSDDQQSLSTHNADLASQFNMANTNLRNQVAMANTGMQNAAQQRNLDARQQNVNGNTTIHNQGINRRDANQQTTFQDRAQALGGVQSALQGQVQGYADANQQAQTTGKIGQANLMSLAGGGAGGAMGGMMGGAGGAAAGGAAGGGGVDFSKYMGMFGG